jgi:hypothetical protein
MSHTKARGDCTGHGTDGRDRHSGTGEAGGPSAPAAWPRTALARLLAQTLRRGEGTES